MSITITRENASTMDYVEQRKARVAEITRIYSKRLLGYSHATIGEIRSEAVRRRLEAILSK